MGVKLFSLSLGRAFRLEPGECLAFSGAGGKTSAIFRLARELQHPVLVSTTTHLASDQLSLADKVIQVDESTDIEKLIKDLDSGVFILIGDETEDRRVSGLSEDKLSQVYSQVRRRGLSLLLEADGARLKPAKAPAEHEPNIPLFVDGVVFVFGLSALGKPLNEDWIHRVEQFSDLSGLSVGDQISAEAVVRVLLQSRGGLKGIPIGVRRYCLLNQADNIQLTSIGNRIARSLIPAYDACLVASLQSQSSPKSESMGLVGDEFSAGRTLHAVREAVYGIILAAGGSDRMGRTKQILPWRGEPLVRHVARSAIDAGLPGITAVVGAAAGQVREALVDLQVEIVDNPEWEVGQSTSVQVGLNHLPRGAGGAIFLLADQPLVPATLIRALIEKRALTMAPIVIPLIDSHRGNPVLFGWETFDELRSIQGDKGGRAIFSNYPLEWVEWHDSAVLNDVDTPEDYKRLISMNE